MAGAITSISSRPMQAALAGVRIEAGHGDARARDAEVAGERRGRDPDGLEQQGPGQRLGHRRQRNVHGGRHNLELLRHQHHHGTRPAAAADDARPARPGTRCGRGRARWARSQRALGDRVGHQRQRLAAHHGGCRRFDRRDDGGIAARSRCGDRHGHDGQRVGKCRRCLLRAGDRSRSARSTPSARARACRTLRVAVERRRPAAPCATARASSSA